MCLPLSYNFTYNANWDVDFNGYHRDTGCIDISDEKLAEYVPQEGDEPENFMAYIKRKSDSVWIGDVNFHYTPEKDWWDTMILFLGRIYMTPPAWMQRK